ncbi:unnamed protein product [Colletotrichum noveboracense]|uniref:BCS1 N-terminal domain-containing protein n=1 Tax=Colletotrichum noveboracense TaxID=2664923 RepID=A0A9W4S439_9PEZI|nr:unnamed protein product [Colletotrichum noveboracense]
MPTSNLPTVSVMDIFFPGFTGVTVALNQLLNGNLDGYAVLLCVCGMLLLGGQFFCNTVGGFIDTYLTSKTDVQDPDEAYDMLKCWVASKDFAKNACSSLQQGRVLSQSISNTAKKPLRFTPWRDMMSFWYKGHLLFLQCTQNDVAFFPRKTITISCVSRSSQILRDLMDKCRSKYLRISENKTSIFKHHNNR